jgi:hypothetical protein
MENHYEEERKFQLKARKLVTLLKVLFWQGSFFSWGNFWQYHTIPGKTLQYQVKPGDTWQYLANLVIPGST